MNTKTSFYLIPISILSLGLVITSFYMNWLPRVLIFPLILTAIISAIGYYINKNKDFNFEKKPLEKDTDKIEQELFKKYNDKINTAYSGSVWLKRLAVRSNRVPAPSEFRKDYFYDLYEIVWEMTNGNYYRVVYDIKNEKVCAESQHNNEIVPNKILYNAPYEMTQKKQKRGPASTQNIIVGGDNRKKKENNINKDDKDDPDEDSE